MDQASFQDLLSTFQARVAGLVDLAVMPGRPDASIVVLVHGIGGCAQHWSNPVGLDINTTWLYDTSTTPDVRNDAAALLCSPPYQTGAVKDWCSALASKGVSSINFSQSQPCGLLALAANELAELLRALEAAVYGPMGDAAADLPAYVLLCHSRGGLVARQALKQLGRDGAAHLAKVISLCTPHGGSYMPRLSAEYDDVVQGRLDFSQLGAELGPLAGMVQKDFQTYLARADAQVRAALAHTFGTTPEGSGFDELTPGSPMLQQLVEGEVPVHGVEYHGFGGGSPGVTSLYLNAAGQLLRLLTVSSPQLIQIMDRCLPELRADYGGLAELDQGDSAVSLASSHWPDPFKATHQDFPINHMQALVDAALQAAVINLIAPEPA